MFQRTLRPKDESVKNQVALENRSRFNRSLAWLLGNNLASATLSIFNEVYIGHSALGFNQALMELGDTGLAAGLKASESYDAKGEHKTAKKIRAGLYSAHIGLAAIGTAESVRLISQDARPSLGNLVVSLVVGALNSHYIYHARQHRKGLAHTQTPDMQMAFDNPVELVQDVARQYPDTATVHQLNEDGATAIAQTNLIEASGGVVGPILYPLISQAPGISSIASNAGVSYVMARQMLRDKQVLGAANH